VTLAYVDAATGFELRVELVDGLLPPPTAAELEAVRAVDPLGVRRSEFGPDELRRTFL
jgi:glutaconate CoA-transferase subunit B